jgi:hypothetical protein
MAPQWRQIWVIFHRDALNCEGTIVNMTVSFLDGAHIPSRPEYQKRHLDVLVGKIDGPRKGSVPKFSDGPKNQNFVLYQSI